MARAVSGLTNNVRKLTQIEQDKVKSLEEDRVALVESYQTMLAKAETEEERPLMLESEEFKALRNKLSAVTMEIQSLKPNPISSGDFIWLFRRH